MMDGDTVSLWSHNIKIVTVTLLTKSRTAKKLSRPEDCRFYSLETVLSVKVYSHFNLVVECTVHNTSQCTS